MYGIKIFERKKSLLIGKEKTCQLLLLCGKQTQNEYPIKLRTVSNLSKVETLVTRENQSTQISISKSLNTFKASMKTINTIINQYLQLKKAKKNNVNQLLPRNLAQ